MTVRYDLNFLL